MEHTYELPKVHDLEAYFDVVTAFVAVLESAILTNYSLDFGIGEEDEKGWHKEIITVEYIFEEPAIRAEWGALSSRVSFHQNFNDINAFSRAFRLWRVLLMEDARASDAWGRKGVEAVKANQPLEPIR